MAPTKGGRIMGTRSSACKIGLPGNWYRLAIQASGTAISRTSVVVPTAILRLRIRPSTYTGF